MTEALQQKTDFLAVVLNKLVNNDNLTEREAQDLREFAAMGERRAHEYQEAQRAFHKIMQLESELHELLLDYPQFKK